MTVTLMTVTLRVSVVCAPMASRRPLLPKIWGQTALDGFQTVDRPRPRARDDTLAQNHGGVAVISFTGSRLHPVDLGVAPVSFDLLCVRVMSGT